MYLYMYMYNWYNIKGYIPCIQGTPSTPTGQPSNCTDTQLLHVTHYNSHYFREKVTTKICLPADPPWDKHGLVTLCACVRGKIIDSVVVVVIVHTKIVRSQDICMHRDFHREGNTSVRYIVVCLTLYTRKLLVHYKC